MRPIKLTMSAFGPYGGVETVDFRDATDAGLFGIYGPTGSGKSSIFSAIAFALFGVGAKEEQAISSMRSHFAPAGALTEVTLLFELGDKRYFVKRIPDQSRAKARGEGETTQSHAAWLFDATALDIDEVGPENCGIPIAERKVGEVLGHIERLLGYGAQQFRQIVLLPQGRFERFLVANSSDRLDILRELFDVSLYRRLTEQLKVDAASAKREIQDGYRLNGHQLNAMGFVSADELVNGIAEALSQHEALQLVSAEKAGILKSATSALAAADAQEKLFAEVELSATNLAEQERRIPEFTAVRIRKSNAELARRLVDLDKAAAVARDRFRLAEAAKFEADETASQARNALENADLVLNGLRAKEGEIGALSRKSDDMTRFNQILHSASERLATFEAAKELCRDAERAQSSSATKQVSAVEALDAKSAALSQAQQNAVALQKLTARRDTLKNERDLAEQHGEAVATVAQSTAMFESAQTSLLESQVSHRDAMDAESRCEREFIAAQAGVLAQHLENGQACPVCGSDKHPNPAHGDGDATRLEKTWRDAQAHCAKAAKAERDAQAHSSSTKATLEAHQLGLNRLAVPDRTLAAIDGEFRDACDGVNKLGVPADAAKLDEELGALRAARIAADKVLEQANLALASTNTNVAVAKQAYDDCISSVPEEWRVGSALQGAINTVAMEIAKRKQTISDAVEQQQAAKSASVKATAELQGAVGKLADCTAAVGKGNSDFASRLAELAVSEAVYRASVPDIDHVEKLGQALSAFDEALISARARNEAAVKSVAGANRPALGPLKDACTAAQRDADEASQQRAKAEQRHKSLLDLQASLAQQLKELQELEELSGPLLGLAEAFDGQNICKTGLETYAIGAMFDQVLDAANLRLDPMTAGRYRFERDAVSMGGRSKRGLDVLVHDIETGRTREIITLSGGETFIAALSLALGLSDVVEMTHGAIRLDTIFIDEGFGSLDTESDAGTLDQVLQVLQNIVGERRAVGLISHVPLVQQAVPNGFTVVKSARGSSIEARIF